MQLTIAVFADGAMRNAFAAPVVLRTVIAFPPRLMDSL